MEKYSDASQLVATLLKMKLCDSEEAAMEKIASGRAPQMIKDFKMKLLNDMVSLYRDQLGDDGMDPELIEEFEKMRKELEET